MKFAFSLFFVLCAGAVQLFAAGQSCESSPAMWVAQRDLNHKLEGATFDQSNALQEAAYQQLRQLDPEDIRPIRQYIQHIRYDLHDQFDAFRENVLSDAKSHPQDPLKLTAAAIVLFGKDTPQAFHLAEQAMTVQPNYAPAYVQLVGMYDRGGKYEDKDKAATYLEKYYQLCPSGFDGSAMGYLKRLGSKDLKIQVAKNLRERLATQTDRHALQFYSDVWSIEFSALPITEHPKERQRVAEDLNRLQSVHVVATAQWLGFLKDGYKQSGAPETQVKAMEARITKEFPHSDEAFDVWYNNWKDQHPQPAGEASSADWQQWMRAAVAHYGEVSTLFPNEHGFGYSVMEYTAHLEGARNEDIVREGEALTKESDLYSGPNSWVRRDVANIFVEHNLEPTRSLALMQEARRLLNSPREHVFSEIHDYSKPKQIDDAKKQQVWLDSRFHVDYLRACRAAGNKSAADELKSEVESAPPTYPEVLPDYWNARAILAEIDGRNTDALVYYQKALFLREPPKPQYGVLHDVLLADAHGLWTTTQGSEAAFAIWSKPDTSNKPVLAEGRWEKPDKELPNFELADLQGKTWKLTQLEGKKVLINIWATWCGPCQSELPHLEKLYEQTKGRTDIAILSLNFDEDLGMVEPFVKKKGFTFPVLPAYAFLANKIDVNSIPRNWLVDANGKWEWEQIGFDSSEPDWEKSMLARLEGTK